MFANRDALQVRAFADFNQREVRRAAPHIDDENERHTFERGRQILPAMRHKVIEGGLGLFQESELFIAGASRGSDSERAGGLIERCRDRYHHFKLFQPSIRILAVPCVAYMEQ